MKKNIILSYLVGLLASLFAVSVQGQNVVMTDTIDMGSYSSPFRYMDKVDAINTRTGHYKMTLHNCMKICISYYLEGALRMQLYLYDVEKKKIGSVNALNPENNYYEADLLAGTYYLVFSQGHIKGFLMTVEGKQIPDAAVNDSHNYLRTRTMTSKDGNDYIENIQYFDALGRMYESTDVGITPNRNDLVSLTEYDDFGRKENEWLPAIVENNNGKYIRRASIKDIAPATYENDREPYSLIEYEDSPLNRILKQYKSGAKWHTQLASERMTYYTNTNDYVRNRDRSYSDYNPFYHSNGSGGSNYRSNSLQLVYKRIPGHEIIENTDARGQIILSRRTLKSTGAYPNGGIFADVQYFYDDIGNLLGAFTPVESDLAPSGVSASHQIYRYQYDYRDRRIASQFPQCEWVYYVYDRADRLIFSQDGEQRKTNQWTFYKYDTMGRQILHGTCITSQTHKELRTLCEKLLIEEDFDKTQPYGYTWKNLSDIIPSDSPVLNACYYDNYDVLGHQNVASYMPVLKGDACYTGDNEGYESQGLLTVSSTTVLGGNSTSTLPLHTLHYYDRMERPVATISDIYSPQNGVEDYKQAEYLSYTFTGNIASKILHFTGKAEEKYDYTYDHAGRHISTRYNLFSNQTDFEKNTYDELGRLISAIPLGLTDQATTYAYDIHSRLTSLQQKHFGEELEYALDDNIIKQKFKKGGIYTFTYDMLSRVEQAVYTDGVADRSCSFSYDKNGNLLFLKRYLGHYYETIDMTYDKNRMIKARQYVSASDDYVFRKQDDNQKEYIYNANGSITQASGRGIPSIKYNVLNLSEQMDIKHYTAEARNEYTYDGNGKRLNALSRWNPQHISNPIIGSAVNEASLTMSRNVLYQANHVWFDDKEMWLNELGYRRPETGKFYFYVKDHQGNNRVVIDQSGTIVQENDYYPYGLPMGSAPGIASSGHYVNTDKQPFKYNGKELDMIHVMILYDYGSRLMEPAFPRFFTVNPSCERYYGISPYAYCANNFVNVIDPDGRDIIVLMDPKSVIGFGHAAVLIGNEKDGWQYYSKDGADNFFSLVDHRVLQMEKTLQRLKISTKQKSLRTITDILNEQDIPLQQNRMTKLKKQCQLQ